jgi:hypothetical protein
MGIESLINVICEVIGRENVGSGLQGCWLQRSCTRIRIKHPSNNFDASNPSGVLSASRSHSESQRAQQIAIAPILLRHGSPLRLVRFFPLALVTRGPDLFVSSLQLIKFQIAQIFDVDHLISSFVDSPNKFIQL